MKKPVGLAYMSFLQETADESADCWFVTDANGEEYIMWETWKHDNIEYDGHEMAKVVRACIRSGEPVILQTKPPKTEGQKATILDIVRQPDTGEVGS